jgi:LPS export ABC transporter protein LptC/lipopolysaccharide transport protein LptA
MTRWHRPARLLLGLFAIVFAVGVYLSIGRRHAPPTATPARLDENVVIESKEGEVILFKGSKQDIRIQHDRRVTYQSGRTKFYKAKVNVIARGGRDFEVTSNEAEVAENQSKIDMHGNVVINASDGLVVKTETATYTQSDETMKAPGPVTFQRARMSGSSVGATYDKTRDVLWLLDQAHIVVTPDEKGQGGVDMTAGGAGYARRDRYLRFERNVKMLRGTQQVEAENAVAYLRDTEDKLEVLELRGNSRVFGVGSGANSLQAMTARDINLNYAEDGQTLQKAILVGDSVVQLANANNGPGQKLTAQSVDVEIAPDGNTLNSLQGRTRVQLDLPANGDTPARQIKSATLDSRAEPGKTGLSVAKFVDQVEFREIRPATPTAAAVDRLVKSRVLDAKVQSGLSQIDEALFNEGVTIKDGPRDASGPTMTYNVAKGQIAITGPVVVGKPSARVDDERAMIQAQRVDWTLDGKNMVADGDVRSVLKPKKDEPPAKPGAPPKPGTKPASTNGSTSSEIKRPAILKSDEPTNVTSKHLVYNSETGHADYTGDAWLWQAETSIKADAITIDENSGNLTASGTVRSTMRLEERDAKGGKPGTDGKTAQSQAATRKPAAPAASGAAAAQKSQLTTATSKDLVYDDAKHLATYTTEARMVGPDGDLKGDKIELYLDDTGRGLERLEAYTKVTFLTTTPKGARRRGTGDRLTYFADDERYVMVGRLAHIVEQMQAKCDETTGQTLTFFKVTDSISVDGNEEFRTQTKSGSACPEPQP